MTISMEKIKELLPEEYEIERHLSTEGQGSVFLGKYKGETAAIKFFYPQNNPQRIQHELSTLPAIKHPNLVELFDTCKINTAAAPIQVVAYKYYSGGDLRQFITSEVGLLSYEKLLDIGLQISEVIELLWSKRIVHRDIKPDNIVIHEGVYVLVDLGVAKFLDQTRVTQPGFNPGTPGYESPEQDRGLTNLTLFSDIFSLGVTLYYLASKQHPFHGSQELIRSQTPPQNLLQIRNDLPLQFTNLIHDMMHFRVFNRPKSIHNRFLSLKP